MSPLDAAASVVLLEFRQSYGLGFVAPNGRVVTCLHVVADEEEILAHLSDGRTLPVRGVAAVDPRRDVAVLDVGLLDAAPVRVGSTRLVDEGQPVHVFGMVTGEGRVRWADAKVSGVQIVGAALSLYTVEGDVPPDASGGPLIATDGSVLGLVTVAETEEGLTVLSVPWRYIEPLLRQNHELPIGALGTSIRRSPRREVPDHPLTLLQGSAVSGLEATTDLIANAIRVGAPAYNEGDIAKCFEVYAAAARRLIDTRDDCPGVQQAMRAGLNRASSLKDVDHRAWAMRDAFDGLLQVIEKYLRSFGGDRRPSKPRLLN